MILVRTKHRIKEFIEYKGITPKEFLKETEIKRGFLDSDKLNSTVSDVFIAKIIAKYPEINIKWLLTGEGYMLKQDISPEKTSKNLIPLYDDVATIGGTEIVADVQGVSKATEYIDAGDWFNDVTAAIRHYGNSMQEYPNGCILALRKITNIRGIVWGSNYVIETNDIRVTKRMQTCPDDDNCIMAYSTNTETYPDGRLVHEPFKIYKEDIRQIFLVIGRVVKEYSSDPVYTLQNN